MKIEIVEGKKVNIDEAKKLGSYQYGNPGDFEHIFEEIYLTRKGNLVFFGEGGAKSEYGHRCGSNTWCGGSEKRFISKKEAFDLLCKWDETDTLFEYFDDMLEEA